MKGTLYGIGVGPGDPELLTLKAARLIEACAVVAAPDSGTGESLALEIARAHIKDQTVLLCDMPMTRDAERLRQSHDKTAQQLCTLLDEGKDIAFLTLGDPSVYSTYQYIHRRVEQKGYKTAFVAGVTSFCAAAAALDLPLCEGGEALHILPASYDGLEQALDLPGTKVLMKSGKEAGRVLELLKQRGTLGNAAMVERCGLSGEKLSRNLTGEEQPGYFTLIVVKE